MKYQVLGNPPNVAVPTHFYKVVMASNKKGNEYALGAFVIPNNKISDTTPIESFLVPLEELERISGVSFFDKLKERNAKFLPLCTETKCILPQQMFWKGLKENDHKPNQKDHFNHLDKTI